MKAKKKQKQRSKKIKLRPGTEENDYQTKLTNLRNLLLMVIRQKSLLDLEEN